MKIAFVGMKSLLDPGSGAAINVRVLLEKLAARGHSCFSFTGGCFDNPFAATVELSLRSLGLAPVHLPSRRFSTWSAVLGGVKHQLFELSSMRLQECASEEQISLVEPCLEAIKRENIDVIISYGGGPFSDIISELLCEEGITRVFYLANPSYYSVDTFINFDLIVTDTRATSKLYHDRLQLNLHPIGLFIDQPSCPIGRSKRYVTFVNPIPQKGVTLFYRIAELASQTLSEAEFLVVESRGTLRNFEDATGLAFSKLPNIRRVGLQADMANILAETNILIMPSLWHESGGRLTIEACSLGIPVVCTDRGGMPELLKGGAIMIPPPPPLIENHMLLPPLTDAIPWVEALRMLLEDEQFYREKSEEAQELWNSLEKDVGVEKFIELVQEFAAHGTPPS